MGDEPSSELTPAELVEAVAKGSTGAFLETIGAGLTETGYLLADWMRFQRFKFQVRVARRAHEILEDAGISARVVPKSILFPLLDGVVLDSQDGDEDEMFERWAALLANAAAADDGADVYPSFPRILSELAPAEARMLDYLARSPAGTNLGGLMEAAGFDQTISGPTAPYTTYVDNLERLSLIYVSYSYPSTYDRQLNERRPVTETPVPNAVVHMSSLGIAFVAACKPHQVARPSVLRP